MSLQDENDYPYFTSAELKPGKGNIWSTIRHKTCYWAKNLTQACKLWTNALAASVIYLLNKAQYEASLFLSQHHFDHLPRTNHCTGQTGTKFYCVRLSVLRILSHNMSISVIFTGDSNIQSISQADHGQPSRSLWTDLTASKFLYSLHPSDPVWDDPNMCLCTVRQHACVSKHVGTAQPAHCSSVRRSRNKSTAGVLQAEQNLGLRCQLSTNVSEIMRIKNAWDLTLFSFREHSVLNYSWQPQWPPHLALSGLNSITFGRRNNMPSLSPNHTSKATLDSFFLCEGFQGIGPEVR